ncbi:alpha/beta hydrolase [Streptomyces sp. NBC_01408]|uniref:alpha/beta hydrolase n=1 Tax=Streptomyces sp. NBC_01408 TaxID=2903855 RepID=UPI0022576A69|nr:alpha/beta hydrolase [Streptomyces sp. NBC_01408]MCX4691700.1 alpha/beta hydrolase [Streptomyces sp. NBC_01408]
MPRSRSRSPLRFRSRVRSRAQAVAAACVLVLALLGATPTQAGPAPPTAGGDPLEPFHGQRLRWGDCPEKRVPDGMRCATVEVPLDYAAPAKGTVEVALARIPATDRKKRIGSLLLNYGGPGGPGIAGLAADPELLADLGERYDLVAFDPRGVGHSEPVSCGGSQQAEEEAAVGDAAEQLAALRAVVRRCELASGPVLPYIGTVNVSRDMDVMRQVLGDKKLNFLGFSYGTRLGAVYAAQFPGKTGRMVLDGVDTLTEPLAEQALASARGQQRALDNFLAWCAHQPGCVYGTNTRTAKKEVEALVARLDQVPLVGHDGSYFTGQDAAGSIAEALYSPRMWPALADALKSAERSRDPAGLLQLGGPTEPPDEQEDEQDQGPVPVPADNGSAALAAVNCADDPDRSDDKATAAAIEKELMGLQGEFLSVSRIFGPLQLMTVLSCYGRPAGTDFIRKIDHPGAPRMLLVGTRGDPATPYEWTEETAARLGSAVVVDHKGDGHTGYVSSACVRGYVDRFLIDGRLPSGTRSCPAGE